MRTSRTMLQRGRVGMTSMAARSLCNSNKPIGGKFAATSRDHVGRAPTSVRRVWRPNTTLKVAGEALPALLAISVQGVTYDWIGLGSRSNLVHFNRFAL